MWRYKKIDRRNLKTHYTLSVGCLYSRPVTKKKEPKQKYYPVENMSYTELYDLLGQSKIELVWLEGPKLKYLDI